jgi:hypothetical protein
MQGVQITTPVPPVHRGRCKGPRWPRGGVRVRQRINRNPSGPDCKAFRRVYCYSPVLRLVVESIPFVGRCPSPSLRFLSYRGPCGLCSSIDMDGVSTLHLSVNPSGTRSRTLHRAERIRCADVVGYTVTDVSTDRCTCVYHCRVMSSVTSGGPLPSRRGQSYGHPFDITKRICIFVERFSTKH